MIALVISLAFIIALDVALYPNVKSIALQKAKANATVIIHECVIDILDKGADEYKDLINFEKNQDGKIVAMKTDSVAMNKLKSSVAVSVQNELYGYSHDDMYSHLGSILNSGFFAGKGPKVKFCIKPSGAVECNYRNLFESAGINQTNHQIMLDISVSVYIILPLHSVTEKINTSVCISDTIIVGEVPQAFTNVQNFSADDEGDTVADEIIDFGAHSYID